MAFLIDETPEANSWVEKQFAPPASDHRVGRLTSAVIWSDSHLENVEPIGGNDPTPLVQEINDRGLPLLHGHDPGRPAGRVIAARSFTSPSGTRFIAAILAYYDADHLLNFATLGIDPSPVVRLPTELREYEGARIQFGVDPREVSSAWLADASTDAPVPVEPVSLSHNAAESVSELLRIGLPYAALVWNPLVKTVAEQVGKDIYAGISQWLQRLWGKISDLREPIVELQSQHHGCVVSFLLRGKNVERHLAAHAALSEAAVQAAIVIDRFQIDHPGLISLVYEFEDSRWIPSYGIIGDGRIVSDRSLLIAFEQAPRSLSIGLLRRSHEKRSPKVFLSYAFEDRETALRIADALAESGIQVAFDGTEISAGGSLSSRISKSIAASDYLLILISETSVHSAWVQWELEGLLSKEMKDRAIMVIPVLLNRVEIPLPLRNRVHVDLSGDEEQGIAFLRRQLLAAPKIDFASMDYSSFETMVATLFSMLGFETNHVGHLGAKNAGFDFSATYQAEDPIGQHVTSQWLVECKLYKEERVSVAFLQRLFATLSERPTASQALVVTNGRLTSVAERFLEDANKKAKRPLRVMDGDQLTALLLRYPQIIEQFFPRGVRG